MPRKPTLVPGAAQGSPKIQTVRPRPSLAAQPVEVREAAMSIAEIVHSLIDTRLACGGKLPPNALSAAQSEVTPHVLILRQHSKQKKHASSMTLTKMAVLQLIKTMEAYQAVFPDRPSAEAFVPQAMGRPKGRDISDDISQFIKEAALKRNWKVTPDGGETVVDVNQVLSAKLLLDLVKSHFGDKADTIKLMDIYHALEDLRAKEPALFEMARTSAKTVRNNALVEPNPISRANELWTFDLRPLPILFKNGDIICSVSLLLIVDQATKYYLGWRVLPGKRLEDGEDELTKDLTAREFRSLLGITLRTHNIRPQALYADNGAQFRDASLKRYMPYLTAKGEPETELLHSPPDNPRGRGTIERHLAIIDSAYLKSLPGYVTETDYNDHLARRRVEQAIRRGQQKVATYQQLNTFISKHLDRKNQIIRADDTSPLQEWQTIANAGLSLPSEENLMMFAGNIRTISVDVQKEGVRYNKKYYKPVDMTGDAGKQLIDAALDRDYKRRLLIVNYGSGHYSDDDKVVMLINFNRDGRTFHRLIESGKNQTSAPEKRRRIDDLERTIVNDLRVKSTDFDAMMEATHNGPLILDALEHTFIPAPPRSTLESAVIEESPSQPTEAKSKAVLKSKKVGEKQPKSTALEELPPTTQGPVPDDDVLDLLF